MLGDRETQLILQSYFCLSKLIGMLAATKKKTPEYDRLFRIAIRARNRHRRRAQLAPEIMRNSAAWEKLEIPEKIKHVRKEKA